MKHNFLLLYNSKTGDESVPINEIRTLSIKKESKAGKGAAMRFLFGGIIGFALGTSSGNDPPGWFSFTSGEKGTVLGMFLGSLGALIGLMIGSAAGGTETIQIEGKSEAELKEILEDLRKKARVPNFQ